MIYFNVLRGLDFTGKITFKNFKKEVSIFDKTMTCCPECGHPLEKKFLKDEGDIPYCSQCASFRFPVFNKMCIRDSLKGNGGAQRFPQNGWKSFAECKGIRELDCESYNSSRDESRA